MICAKCDVRSNLDLLKVCRIYTEDTNRAGILAILNQYFKSFNITQTIGCWEGAAENSLIIEVTMTAEEKVYSAAHKIRSFGAGEN
jgi:hypothetical protein